MAINPSQKLNTPKRGQPTRADNIGHIIAAMKRMIVGGKGIVVDGLGDQIRISAKQGPIPTGSGGGGDQVDYTAASKTLLEAYTGVVEYARGRVTAGADKGVVYVRNPDNDGWDALNRLE